MPGRFVVHLHATLVNQFSCCREGRRLVQDNLGDDVIWVDLVDPGFALAKPCKKSWGLHPPHRQGVPAGRDHAEPRARGERGDARGDDRPYRVAVPRWLRPFGSRPPRSVPQEPGRGGRARGVAGHALGAQAEVRALVNVIGPALRGLLSRTGEPLKVVTFDDSAPVLDLVAREGRPRRSHGGTSHAGPDRVLPVVPALGRGPARRAGRGPEGAPRRRRARAHRAPTRCRPSWSWCRAWACSRAGTPGRTPTPPASCTSTPSR